MSTFRDLSIKGNLTWIIMGTSTAALLLAVIVSLVLLASTLLALVLSARLQLVISEPILRLEQTAKTISERKFGSGGMGIVYKAEDTRLGRNVVALAIRPLPKPTHASKTCFHEKALSCQDRLGGQKSGTG